MPPKAKMKVRCVVCRKAGFQLCDLDAPYPQGHGYNETICISCVFKYRPEDTYTYVTHKVSADAKQGKKAVDHGGAGSGP